MGVVLVSAVECLIVETAALPERPAEGALGRERKSAAEFDLCAVVSRCMDGDADAVRAFVMQFERAVLGLCLRMLRDHHEAEDIAQETFVRAVRNLDKWDPNRPIMPWLQTIAANRCRTALGKRQRRPRPAVSLPEQSVTIEDNETVEEVDRAIAMLPDRFRDVITLHYRGGLGCTEIAEILGCAEGTVKTWLFRARQQLADELRGRGFGEQGFAEEMS